jgi:hypothetical protein
MYMDVLSHIKVTVKLLGKGAYMFRNWKVKRWLNESTYQYSTCLKVVLW